MRERVQKVLARAGFGSRRACEQLIRQGQVRVNGRLTQLGDKADPGADRITVDGRLANVQRRRVYVALNKPNGVLSDEGDGTGRLPTARGMIDLPGRLFPVGRLDLRSEGLLLITNDGELAYALTHPRFEHTKEYEVKVSGSPDEHTLRVWRRGVHLDGRRTAPARVAVMHRSRDETWLRVVLHEGRKRQIRRVAAVLGYPVRRLIRVRIGPISLGDLPPGKWRYLSKEERHRLEEFRARARSQPRKPKRTHFANVKVGERRDGRGD